jgi:hypothetical protein
VLRRYLDQNEKEEDGEHFTGLIKSFVSCAVGHILLG